MRSGRSGGGAGDRAAPAAWFHDRWIAFIGEAATFLTQGVTAAAGCQGGGSPKKLPRSRHPDPGREPDDARTFLARLCNGHEKAFEQTESHALLRCAIEALPEGGRAVLPTRSERSAPPPSLCSNQQGGQASVTGSPSAARRTRRASTVRRSPEPLASQTQRSQESRPTAARSTPSASEARRRPSPLKSPQAVIGSVGGKGF